MASEFVHEGARSLDGDPDGVLREAVNATASEEVSTMVVVNWRP